MIYVDVTNAARSAHHSGLQRVSRCLRAAFASRAGVAPVEVVWRAGSWRLAIEDAPAVPDSGDWLLTPEVFGPAERPGFTDWLDRRRCRAAALYYDAIPLKLPSVTWPRSVGRHPAYMKQLARFDRVFAISAASREELLGYWAWARTESRAAVSVIPLGADGAGTPRATDAHAADRARGLLMVGIVEPRKNQSLMIEVCEGLWETGLQFDLHIVGRTNPHFGRPIARRAAAAAGRHAGLRLHGPLDDAAVRPLGARCRAAVFPSRAEGNGLPVIEALWEGLPCVCSRVPALEENAAGGGCLLVAADDAVAWEAALRSILTDDNLHSSLRAQALSRPLPRWSDTAAAVLAAFEGG